MPTGRAYTIALAAVVAGVLAACPASAFADGSAGIENGVLHYRGDPGPQSLFISEVPEGVLVKDEGHTVTPGPGCQSSGPHYGNSTVLCPRGDVSSLLVETGDGGGSAGVSAAIPATMVGGADGDSLSGGPANDVLRSGPGKDTISGNDGADNADAGEGDDTVDAGAGDDTVVGGPGTDDLKGGDGNDSVDSLDGAADKVACGAGTDRLRADAGQFVADQAFECEQVQQGYADGSGGAVGGRPSGPDESGDFGDLNYFADDGNHDMTVSDAGGGFELREPRGIQVFAPCTRPSGDTAVAQCPPTFLPEEDLRLTFGPGDDRLTSTASSGKFRKGVVVDGGPGADQLSGGPGMDALRGGPGDDQLTGGGGADGLGGGDGNDTIQSRDGEVDGVSCGDGADTALVDWLDDTTKSGCETLKLGDTDPPARYGVTIGKRVAVPKKHTGFGDRYVMNVKVGCPRKARGGCAGQFKLCRDAGCQDKIRLYAVKVRAGRTQVVSQRLESTLSTYAGQLAKKHRATMWGVAVVRDSAGHTRSTFTKLSLRASR